MYGVSTIPASADARDECVKAMQGSSVRSAGTATPALRVIRKTLCLTVDQHFNHSLYIVLEALLLGKFC